MCEFRCPTPIKSRASFTRIAYRFYPIAAENVTQHLSVLSIIIGLTAWHGVNKVPNPASGEIVVVSGGAGAVDLLFLLHFANTSISVDLLKWGEEKVSVYAGKLEGQEHGLPERHVIYVLLETGGRR
jgi:hypothetical protein